MRFGEHCPQRQLVNTQHLGRGRESDSAWGKHMGVSENRGPYYSTLNGGILFVRTP